MKQLRYTSGNGIEVIIKPDNPMTVCEMYVKEQLASYGISICKEGDLFSLEYGMRKAFESALKRQHTMKKIDRIPRKYWVEMYKDFNNAFRPWLESYKEKLAKEQRKMNARQVCIDQDKLDEMLDLARCGLHFIIG